MALSGTAGFSACHKTAETSHHSGAADLGREPSAVLINLNSATLYSQTQRSRVREVNTHSPLDRIFRINFGDLCCSLER